MQPLSATVPLSSTPAPAASAAAAPEPAPVSWTPMRTYSSMQPRGGAGLSLKRGRPDGSPVGQPLLGAGLTGDSERRIRRRGEQVSCCTIITLKLPPQTLYLLPDRRNMSRMYLLTLGHSNCSEVVLKVILGIPDAQGVGSAERRVWKAGQGPHKGPAGREVLAIEGPAATRATATADGVAGSREPLPMTESARRIAMALDSMLPVSCPPTNIFLEQLLHHPPGCILCWVSWWGEGFDLAMSCMQTSAPQGEAQSAATSAPQKPVPPPRDSLAVAPRPVPSAAPPPAMSSLALPLTPHVDAFPNLASSWATQPQPAASSVQQPAKSGQDTQRPVLVPSAPPAASWSTWSSRPTISLPVDMDFTAGLSCELNLWSLLGVS